jgi:hypothetical protein
VSRARGASSRPHCPQVSPLAGQPKRAKIIAELTRRAIEKLERADATPLDYAEEWVASGDTLVGLAKDLSGVLGVEVWRAQLSKILHEIGGSEAEARLERARRAGAHALAEASRDIADDESLEKDDVPRAKLRIDTRLRIAEAWNPSELGRKQGTVVNVTIGNLHLDSLRSRPAQATLSTPAEVVVESQDDELQRLTS